MTKVSRKSEMYAMLRAGLFGNQLRTWPSLDQAKKDGYRGLYGLRYTVPGERYFATDLSEAQLPVQLGEFIKAGADPDRFVLCEASPVHRITFQGEFGWTSVRELVLFGARGAGLHMRDALRERGEHFFGARACIMLSSVMDSRSYEDVRDLIDRFPTAIVEFTSYDTNVGQQRGRNTVIWEVRDY